MADRLNLRRRLHELAFRQAGYFTAGQAVQVGYTHQAQKYHADRGNWIRLGRGLFRLAEWPTAADDVYARGAAWSEGTGVVSHQSAADVHDLGDLDAGPLHLTLQVGRSAPDGFVVHVDDLDDADVEDRGAYRVTTPRRTVLDLASADITQEQLDAVIVDAVAAGQVEPASLRHRVDLFGHRAALRVERALTAVEGRT